LGRKEPARLYTVEPPSLSTKKPWPLSARSMLLLVVLMLPWVNCWDTAATFTPLPVALRLTPYGETANMSENSARDCLKPVVEELAMLLAVTFRSC
jgi:hypothetical protein